MSKQKIFIAAFPSLEVNNPTSVYALNGAGESNAGNLGRSMNLGKSGALGRDGWLLSDEDFKQRENNKLHIK